MPVRVPVPEQVKIQYAYHVSMMAMVGFSLPHVLWIAWKRYRETKRMMRGQRR